VPSIQGLSKEQATARFANCSCDLVFEEANSSSVPTGQAIGSDPIAGAVIWGGDVTITISTGAKLVSAPKLVGLNVAEATAEVLKSGFKLGKVSSWFNQAPIGTIYEYQGSDGTKIAENSTIDLKISLGALPVLSNIDEALATTALQAAGLKVVQVTQAASDTVAMGKVINFIPLTDPIGAGGEVELIVSSGPAN
jgi:serine/threonine-protein kinase